MEKNVIEKYELIDGHAVIDADYNIITANEEMYRFIGISVYCSVIDIIHQVDLDDFIDVANCLRDGQSKDMVIRMRRSDNSYRWMLIHLARYQFTSTDTSFEYLEMHASDILALQRQNGALQNSLQNFRHLLAMENELFFTYDYQSHLYQINNFIDNEIHNLVEMNVYEFRDHLVAGHFISDASYDEFEAYCKDLEQGTVSYTHIFETNFLTKKPEYDAAEFRGMTIYDNSRPRTAVGSIRNLSNSSGSYSNVHTYQHTGHTEAMSYDDIRQFCNNNILYNPDCQLTLILMEMDHLSELQVRLGAETAERLYDTMLSTTRDLIGYRGIMCELQKNLICIAIRDINSEVSLRSFLETLRNQITWNNLLNNSYDQTTFSIGIARYPQNGRELSKVHRKLVRALEIAHERGFGRYIIYREHLHGELP